MHVTYASVQHTFRVNSTNNPWKKLLPVPGWRLSLPVSWHLAGTSGVFRWAFTPRVCPHGVGRVIYRGATSGPHLTLPSSESQTVGRLISRDNDLRIPEHSKSSGLSLRASATRD